MRAASHGRSMRVGWLMGLWLSLSWTLLARKSLPTVAALKHDYITKDDDRLLIAPLGFPFGFLRDGVFNITVYDFDLKQGGQDLVLEGDEGLYYEDGGARGLGLFGKKSKHKSPSEALETDWRNDIYGVGFLLKKFHDEADFNRYIRMIESNSSYCILADILEQEAEKGKDMGDDNYGHNFALEGDNGVAVDGILMDMSHPTHTWGPKTPSMAYTFNDEKDDEVGLYFLMYQLCFNPGAQTNVRTTFKLDFHFYNKDRFGRRSYLSAGQMILPFLFFYFAIAYAVATYVWFKNIALVEDGQTGYFSNPTRGQPIVYPIHRLMGWLLVVKGVSLFFEAIRYHYLRVTGQAVLWTGVYYFFAIVKGFFLFVVLLLLGSGWSFVKPFLGEREKKIFFVVLILQFLNNVAMIVLSDDTEGERAFDHWTAILHLVDILCCCVILVPIVWRVNELQKNMEQSNGDHNDTQDDVGDDDDAVVPEDEMENVDDVPQRHANGRLLNKLRLFRSFYLLVMVYIYVTRIVVYLFSVQLDYRHTWVKTFVVESVTLAFYVLVGMQFRPMGENPYLTIEREEDFEGALGEVELEVRRSRRPLPP